MLMTLDTDIHKKSAAELVKMSLSNESNIWNRQNQISAPATLSTPHLALLNPHNLCDCLVSPTYLKVALHTAHILTLVALLLSNISLNIQSKRYASIKR
ncbi:hypothetical protein DYBT9623_00766 [Dyadobacter sp. CECT 9623]|uniref:Uncharacterized protein n=1 Tax=Dyadobacter linearis TaxID=2823330 RepID=A0ABM8UKV6_9BACT|nr:hypothetical protein DYBT9623_00766 [Dyadobacter sp. CECT 9623]